MDALDTVVAGLSCREVLHRLSDFLDGDLPPAAVERVTAHLAGCRRCAQFGGKVGMMIAALRATAAVAPDEVPDGATERLRVRLARERR